MKIISTLVFILSVSAQADFSQSKKSIQMGGYDPKLANALSLFVNESAPNSPYARKGLVCRQDNSDGQITYVIERNYSGQGVGKITIIDLDQIRSVQPVKLDYLDGVLEINQLGANNLLKVDVYASSVRSPLTKYHGGHCSSRISEEYCFVSSLVYSDNSDSAFNSTCTLFTFL